VLQLPDGSPLWGGGGCRGGGAVGGEGRETVQGWLTQAEGSAEMVRAVGIGAEVTLTVAAGVYATVIDPLNVSTP